MLLGNYDLVRIRFRSFSQNFEEDLNQNLPVYQSMESNGSVLVTKCRDMNVSNGLNHVKEEMEELDDRYKSLKSFADKERERILETGKQLDECQIQLTPIEDLIRLTRRTLEERALFDDEDDQGKKLIADIEVWPTFQKRIAEREP